MSFTLRAKADVADLDLSIGGWSDLLDLIGLPIGAGRSLHGRQIYQQSKANIGPSTNDGYRVSDGQARAMARNAAGLLLVWREIIDRYGLPALEAEQERIATRPMNVRRIIEDLERFASWAMKSKGFVIE